MTADMSGADVISGFDWRYVEQFLIAIFMTSLTVLTHYTSMGGVRRYFRQFWATKGGRRTRLQVMVGIAGIMMAAHFVEVSLWASMYYLRGILHSPIEAMYFSIASYSTMGESGFSLPHHWQGLGGFESMNAMLMFGWSTAMLAAVVMKMHNLDD
ncbi:hypothetical protein ACFL00_02900 [Pseudomonadota bacterium]